MARSDILWLDSDIILDWFRTLTAELNQKAKAILIRELGPVGYARFIYQYEQGSVNYTTERHQWLSGESAPSLHEEASQLTADGNPSLFPFPNSTSRKR